MSTRQLPEVKLYPELHDVHLLSSLDSHEAQVVLHNPKVLKGADEQVVAMVDSWVARLAELVVLS